MMVQKNGVFIFLFAVFSLNAQQRVLHYTETSGYDHQTRANSLAMFEQFGTDNNFAITHDLNGANFSSLANLLQFDLIVFANTSGDAILDSTQKSNFEAYMNNGGALLGIHAATDTYRHSSANGSLTGTWDFFPEILGGSVQENPNHVTGTPNYAISKVSNHPILDPLPSPWMKNEEFYYWQNGYLNTDNMDLLKVETTVGPNNQVNSYDSSRTVAWYRISSNNSRIFYTSLGHSNSDYTSDSMFQKLVLNGTLWCLNRNVSLSEKQKPDLEIFPVPARDHIYLEGQNLQGVYYLKNLAGKVVVQGEIDGQNSVVIDVSNLNQGVYFITFLNQNKKVVKKLVLQ